MKLSNKTEEIYDIFQRILHYFAMIFKTIITCIITVFDSRQFWITKDMTRKRIFATCTAMRKTKETVGEQKIICA